MKLCRCPVCHSDIHLDQLLEDEAGREILGLLTELKYGVARPLVSYIALFRPDKSALSNSRAVKLMREVLDLFPVQKKRRESRNLAPLNNHRYLMQVMETNRPLFSGTGSAAVNNAERQQAERANHGNDDIENTILYIERFYQLGQQVEHLPGYDVWKKWKDKQQK